jgi:hypothetical protein
MGGSLLLIAGGRYLPAAAAGGAAAAASAAALMWAGTIGERGVPLESFIVIIVWSLGGVKATQGGAAFNFFFYLPAALFSISLTTLFQ